jgi:aminoglycoside phosphotransferase (APT) family kinase protein
VDTADIARRLAAHVAKETGKDAHGFEVSVLGGGACQENFKVTATIDGEAKKYVLRSDAPTSLPGSIDREKEYAVMRRAGEAGVKTPAVRWFGKGLVRDGAAAYFTDWRDGEAIGRKVVAGKELAGARERLAGELATELAKIHAITPASAPELFGGAAPPTGFDVAKVQLERMLGSIDQMRAPRPAMELIHRWLREHTPPPAPPVLVHGDFRTGNFLVVPQGLSAILDWEFAHWGSPYEDLTWVSVRDWRFNQLALPVGGFSRREPFYEAYEKASGRTLDPKALFFWEVFGNLSWAIGSVYQVERYVYGGVEDFELVAIGRRAAEMEFEAMRLLERGKL